MCSPCFSEQKTILKNCNQIDSNAYLVFVFENTKNIILGLSKNCYCYLNLMFFCVLLVFHN